MHLRTLVIFQIRPRKKEAYEPIPKKMSEGEIQLVMKNALGAAFWALLFFSPEFANTRWPWELNPFDSRIMSAWFAGSSIWAATMYFMKDWVEIKIGIRSLLFFILSLLSLWILASPRYILDHTEVAARQGIVFGLAPGGMAGWLLYAYWKQEHARKYRIKKAACLELPF